MALADHEVLLAVTLFLAAVVVLLVLRVLGPAHGPLGAIDEQFTQSWFGPQETLQVGGPAGGQMLFVAQGLVEHGGEPARPLAGLLLGEAEEEAHDLLQGVALEVKEDEQELVGRCRQGSLAYPTRKPAGARFHG